MSKIEKALRKAKQESAESPASVVNKKEIESVNKSLQPTEKSATKIVDRVSSVKEITLMNERDELENNQLSELKVIFSDMPDNKHANVYRDLRTKLLHNNRGENFIVMITSCMSGEDSGSVALNLATAFSFDNSKTSLLIDCDLYNPTIDSMLDLDTDIGLTDYLESDAIDVDSIIHKTGIKRLRVVPAGSSRETASEYFTSSKMSELLEEFYARYTDRYIFIHSPSITDSADAKILIELCNYVILVVPYGHATKNRIKSAADAIGSDKLLGVVFNNIPNTPGSSIRKKNG